MCCKAQVHSKRIALGMTEVDTSAGFRACSTPAVSLDRDKKSSPSILSFIGFTMSAVSP
jgi:hypothetical protein